MLKYDQLRRALRRRVPFSWVQSVSADAGPGGTDSAVQRQLHGLHHGGQRVLLPADGHVLELARLRRLPPGGLHPVPHDVRGHHARATARRAGRNSTVARQLLGLYRLLLLLLHAATDVLDGRHVRPRLHGDVQLQFFQVPGVSVFQVRRQLHQVRQPRRVLLQRRENVLARQLLACAMPVHFWFAVRLLVA